MLTKTDYQSPLGQMILVNDEEALLGLWFADQKYVAAGFNLAKISERKTQISEQVINWLNRYFNQEAPSSSQLPLQPQVTAYRERVLAVLKEVSYGQTVTYNQLAQALKATGAATSPRAIGGAVGHNPISIVIPCHRVVGSDGSLIGYAGGLERKIALLTLEGVDCSQLK